MTAFKALRDVSNTFENDLRRVSNELFTAKISETFEDSVAKKLRDLTLYTSKLRLLQAKTTAASPQITEQQYDEQSTLVNYGDTVQWKLIEQLVVKTMTQSQAVKELVTASDSSLQPDMVERKEKIIDQLTKFKEKEIQLRHLDAVLTERQEHLDAVRREWDEQLGLLRDMQDDGVEASDDHSNPLTSKLQQLEGKLKLLRALLARLATARGDGYDWLADPRRRLRALQLARQ
ncbi:uncharacterized protein [Epargyreus clarus]|uniref:uncharacterized protein n=1 Tax=Epargyreus clarus TaxID=520877 RepID=UPI003C2E7506